MIPSCLLILGQSRDSGNDLVYVIAVLILSVIGVVVEKLRPKPPGPNPPGKPTPVERRPQPATVRPQSQPTGARPTEPVARHRRPAPRPLPAEPRPSQPVLVEVEVEPITPALDTLRTIAAQVEARAMTPSQPATQVRPTQSRTTHPPPIALEPFLLPRTLSTRDLRRAIILSEVLQAPLALRDLGPYGET